MSLIILGRSSAEGAFAVLLRLASGVCLFNISDYLVVDDVSLRLGEWTTPRALCIVLA